MPTITFNDIDELQAYVNLYIKENHANEITGTQHNNVESGLIKFIKQSPRNYNKAYVTASAGAFVATALQCVLIFKAGATGSITLTNNQWNEWVIYNNSGANKTLSGSIGTYVSILGITRNYIPAGQGVCLAKASDGIWYEVGNTSKSKFTPLAFEIGVDAPIVEGDTELVISVTNPVVDSEWISLDNNWIQPDVTGQISYSAVYTASTITITFNQGVIDGQKYFIKYATN